VPLSGASGASLDLSIGRGLPTADVKIVKKAGAMPHVLAVVLMVAVAVPAALAARKPTDPKLVPNPADVRIAHRLLLTKAEAGSGFYVEKASSSGDTDCAGYKEPDLHMLTETADVDGPELGNKASGTTLASSASIFVSAGQAAQAFQTVKARALGSCLLNALKTQGMKNGRVTPVHLSVGRLEIFAWDATGTVTAHGRTVPLEMTFAGYRYSRAVSFLMVAGIPTTALEQKAKELSARMTLSLMRARL
jgi:hypothetical protein